MSGKESLQPNPPKILPLFCLAISTSCLHNITADPSHVVSPKI